MRFNKTQVAGLTTVILAVAYSISRWRDASRGADEQTPTTGHHTGVAD